MISGQHSSISETRGRFNLALVNLDTVTSNHAVCHVPTFRPVASCSLHGRRGSSLPSVSFKNLLLIPQRSLDKVQPTSFQIGIKLL